MRALFNIQRLEGPCVQRVLLNLLAMTVLQATTRTAGARTWTVDNQTVRDFAVIQDAVSAAAPGDTILIYPGRYTELVAYDFGALTESTFVVIDKPHLTLRGVDRESVVIGPQIDRWTAAFAPNGIAMSAEATNLTIEDLRVENMPEGIVLENPATVRDVTIRGCSTGIAIWSTDAVLVERVSIGEGARFGVASWSIARNSTFSEVVAMGQDSRLVFSNGEDVTLDSITLLDGAFVQFQSGTRGTIRNSTFQGAGVIVLMADATIEDCFFGPANTVAIEASESQLVASGCVFSGGNQGTLFLRAGTQVTMQHNHILHTALPAVDIRFYFDAVPGILDLSNNWWGTTDPAEVAEWIIDANDIPDRGATVTYEPIATQPLPTPKKSIGSLKALYGDPRTP